MFPKFTGLIEYDEFVMLNSEVKLNEIKEYLEKIHETNSNKRTRDSSTAFLDPYEHIDFRPLFEGLTNRYETGFPSLITNFVVFVLRYCFSRLCSFKSSRYIRQWHCFFISASANPVLSRITLNKHSIEETCKLISLILTVVILLF